MAPAALWIVAAVLAQGVLVFILTALLYQERIPRITKDEIRIADIAIDKTRWPERARLVENAFGNQFEVPVLLFVACGVALYFGATWIEAVLALLFVVTRYVHAFIHVTNNRVPRRFFAYAAGVVIVGLFWVDLMVRLAILSLRGGA